MSRSASKLIEQFRQHTADAGLSAAEPVIAGVSGGADSMALLHLLYRFGFKAHIVHVNYGKRGAESDKDQALVEQKAAEWGFECHVFSPESDQPAQNFQNYARQERYSIFRRLKDQYNAAAVLTAHHRDDQVETILQKLFRGSGITAWQGMPVWDGELLRPLLHGAKEEIVEYCRKYEIPFRTDASNLESEYARNFIRNKFGPDLNRFFPGWEANILELPARAGTAAAALQELLNITLTGTGKELNLEQLSEWPEALQTAVLKQFADYLGLSLSKGQLHELLKLCGLETGKKLALGGGHEFVKDRSTLVYKSAAEVLFTTKIIHKEDLRRPAEIGGRLFSLSKSMPSGPHLRMDAQKLTWPLKLRTWQPGDRIGLLGLDGSQKISDYLTNLKVSAAKKSSALALSAVDGTIYAILLPESAQAKKTGAIAGAVRCTGRTTEYLIIESK